MKKLSIISFLFITLFNGNPAWSGWIIKLSPSYNKFQRIYFSNENMGCIEMMGFGLCNDTLRRTTDGGNNWSYVHLYPFQPYNDYFTSKYGFSGQDLFVTTVEEYVYPAIITRVIKSADLGLTWSVIYTLGPNNNYRFIYKNLTFSKNIGFFVATDEYHPDQTYMWRTTNGGGSWGSTTLLNLNFIINSPSYSNVNPSVVFGIYSGIIKSTDYGANFSTVLGGSYSRVCVIDSFNVMAINGSSLYRSTNLGLNWTTNSFNNTLNSIFFPDPDTGYITGNNGKIFKSTDKGITWGQQITSTSDNLVDCYFINASTGYAIGYNGTVLKTNDGGGPVTNIKNVTIPIASDFCLYQNYPNPFNPVTRIKYFLPYNSFVLLKIFNLTGQEISTLVSEKQTAGVYEIKWDGMGCPSGVYFYQLFVDKNKIETKKMVLTK